VFQVVSSEKKNLYALLISHMRDKRPTNLIPFDLINLTIGEGCNSGEFKKKWVILYGVRKQTHKNIKNIRPMFNF
jgi:hypothetical protein